MALLTGRRAASVGRYLVASFAICLLGVAALVASTSRATFSREQRDARSELRSASQMNVDVWNTDNSAEVMQSLVGAPGLASGTAAECDAGLAALKSVTTTAHLHVVGVKGNEICSIRGDDIKPGPVAVGPWLAQALASPDFVVEPPSIDPLSGEPAITGAIAASADRVIVVVGLTGRPALDLPHGANRGTVVVTLDPDRKMVLAATPKSPIPLGATSLPAAISHRIPAGGITAKGPDGKTWLWQEVRTENKWPVIAGMPKSVAFAAANRELRQSLEIGGVVLLLVALAALRLHRRLVKPVRALHAAIETSRSGDHSMRAPIGGPSELAGLATAYNEMIDWREDLEESLRQLARHDPLTGLPNRLLIGELLDGTLVDIAVTAQLAVIFVDLDRFKLINDSYGHAVGDILLRALGARFSESLPENCTVGRFGGDEFVFVCNEIKGEREAKKLAKRVADVLKAPFTVNGQKLYASGSVGITLAQPGDAADDLIRNADTAMYRAKETERGGIALFDANMRASAVARLETERELHHGIEREEFTLYYQPVFSLSDRKPVGAEALIRWIHPERGLVGPLDFIPVAEETGLIVPMGEWVVREACREAAHWRSTYDTNPHISINLAAKQLARADIVERIAAILEDTGCEPGDITLEITESAVLADTESAIYTLHRLRGMGLRISVDDFGTGYSSLSYLQRLPIDEVKIDRSFVDAVATDASTRAIVASIVQLAHALDLTVVAEGVETEAQFKVLRALNCDIAQGFLLGRPQPATDVAALWAPARKTRVRAS